MIAERIEKDNHFEKPHQDTRPEGVVDVVGDHEEQVEMETAGHTGLALEPEESCFGEEQPNVQLIRTK